MRIIDIDNDPGTSSCIVTVEGGRTFRVESGQGKKWRVYALHPNGEKIYPELSSQASKSGAVQSLTYMEDGDA